MPQLSYTAGRQTGQLLGSLLKELASDRLKQAEGGGSTQIWLSEAPQWLMASRRLAGEGGVGCACTHMHRGMISEEEELAHWVMQVKITF